MISIGIQAFRSPRRRPRRCVSGRSSWLERSLLFVTNNEESNINQTNIRHIEKRKVKKKKEKLTNHKPQQTIQRRSESIIYIYILFFPLCKKEEYADTPPPQWMHVAFSNVAQWAIWVTVTPAHPSIGHEWEISPMGPSAPTRRFSSSPPFRCIRRRWSR